ICRLDEIRGRAGPRSLRAWFAIGRSRASIRAHRCRTLRSGRPGDSAQDRAADLQCLAAPAATHAHRKSRPDSRRPRATSTANGRYTIMSETDLRSSYAWCEAVARKAARHFYPAFRLLPRAQRRAMCALYAFMRLTDDLADEPGNLPTKRGNLLRW